MLTAEQRKETRGKMMTKFGTIILLMTVLWAGAGRGVAAQAPNARAEYSSILKEFDDAQEQARKAYQTAKTDAERLKASEKFPNPERFGERFLALAERNPNSPAALDALIWTATQCYYNATGEKALNRLARDYVQSEKLGPVCDRLVHAHSDAAKNFLQAVTEKNSNREVQGKAYFALAKQNMTVSAAEADRLFTLVRDKYGSVKYGHRTLAEVAKAELFELHHLAIRKVAPEIKGVDADGKQFKLSDYRGKVVVLDFWGDW